MSVPNFSSLAGLEVAEKFVVVSGGVVEHLATMSNSNKVALKLSWVDVSYVGFWQKNLPQYLNSFLPSISSMTT